MTEPQAGSDASAIETTAERDGDDLLIDGQKSGQLTEKLPTS